MMKKILILSLLVGATLCRQPHKRWNDFEVKHEWVKGGPSGWEVLGLAPSDERLAVRIGLKQDGLEDLIEHLHAVSDPSHRRYGSSSGYTVCLIFTDRRSSLDTANTCRRNKSTPSLLLIRTRLAS